MFRDGHFPRVGHLLRVSLLFFFKPTMHLLSNVHRRTLSWKVASAWQWTASSGRRCFQFRNVAILIKSHVPRIVPAESWFGPPKVKCVAYIITVSYSNVSWRRKQFPAFSDFWNSLKRLRSYEIPEILIRLFAQQL